MSGDAQFDKVAQASLNGIYIKAQELDRPDNDAVAPPSALPGRLADAETHASTHASDGADAETHSSDR